MPSRLKTAPRALLRISEMERDLDEELRYQIGHRSNLALDSPRPVVVALVRAGQFERRPIPAPFERPRVVIVRDQGQAPPCDRCFFTLMYGRGRLSKHSTAPDARAT